MLLILQSAEFSRQQFKKRKLRMSKITITFSEEEVVELQEILIDEDAIASLDFIKNRIKPKIPKKGTWMCDSSRTNPFLIIDSENNK